MPGSRVVTVSSNAHRTGKINFDDLMWARRYSKSAAYGQSKLANLMFTYELQRRLTAAHVDTLATAAHPGTATTDLTRHSGFMTWGTHARLGPLNSWAVQPATMGALPTLRAATDPGGDRRGVLRPGWVHAVHRLLRCWSGLASARRTPRSSAGCGPNRRS